MPSSDGPVTRSVSEWWRSVFHGVSVTVIGLMLAGGLGLTGHAVGTLASGPDRAVATDGAFRASTGERLTAVATVSYVTPPSEQASQAETTTRSEEDGSADGGGSVSAGATAGQDPGGSPAAPPQPGPSVPAGEDDYLDTAAAVAARGEQGASAPDFDRAMTDLSSDQRGDSQSTRDGQVLHEDNRLHQEVRADGQSEEAAAIAAELWRLEEEKRLAEEEARRLAEEARLAEEIRLAAAEAAQVADDSDVVADDSDEVAMGGADPLGTLLPSEEALARMLAGLGSSRSSSRTVPTVAPISPASYAIAARFGAVGTWSLYHTGIDLAAPIGTPVRAVSGGVVTVPVAGEWAGIHVIVDHGDGSTLSAHLMSSTVVPGQVVETGEVIGYVGMTGRTFGPHLHFEYYPEGVGQASPYGAADPAVWLGARGIWL